MRFVFSDTNFFQNLRGTGLAIRLFGIRISSKILGGRGLRFVFSDTIFFQILRGTGLAIRLFEDEFLPNS